MKRLYLDSSIVIDFMKLKNGINLKPERKELAEVNLKNLRRVMGTYKITIPAIAMGEVVNYIKENIDDGRKKVDCLNWLWDFINEYSIDVLPIVYDVCLFVYEYNNNCVFSVAREIMSRENADLNGYYSGKTLDGNDALILAQVILDEHDEAVILTVDSRMLESTTPHDIIEEKRIMVNGQLKKLRIIDDLSEI